MTLKDFAEWCSKQPPNKQYKWEDERVCPLAQFSNSIGCSYEDTPIAWEIVVMNGGEGQTFGALVSRLEKML